MLPGIKNSAIHRARILEGQMKGLTAGVASEKYCIDLLRHSLAIQKSLKSLDRLILENHLKTCAKRQLGHNHEEKKAIKELLGVFKLSE